MLYIIFPKKCNSYSVFITCTHIILEWRRGKYLIKIIERVIQNCIVASYCIHRVRIYPSLNSFTFHRYYRSDNCYTTKYLISNKLTTT